MPRWRQRSRRQLSWRLIYVTCPPPFSSVSFLDFLTPIAVPRRLFSSPLSSSQVRSAQANSCIVLAGCLPVVSLHYTPEIDKQCISGIAGIVPSIKRNFKGIRERFCPQELDGWRAAFAAGLLDDARFRQHTAFETELGRLAHPQINARHGAKLASQANLAQQH